MRTPLVSVIMPNYNTPEEFLRAAIDSILNQTYKNIELIIVDDASTQNDVEIIRSYRDERIVLLVNESNRHVSYTLNRALAHVKGEYVARMDSDDISLPDRISRQVRFLEHHPDIDVLCAQARMIGERKGVYAAGLQNWEIMKTHVFFNCPVIHPSVMFRASFLKQNDMQYSIQEAYQAAEDYELWSRCIFAGKMSEYPKVLLKYRVHKKQVSSAAAGRQSQGALRVRKNMLRTLDIVPSERESSVHLFFCTETLSPDIPIEETHRWAEKLLESNRQRTVFQAQNFKKLILQHMLVIAAKSLLCHKTSLWNVMSLGLAAQMLNPKYYLGYIKRYVFSKRLNRPI